jgi:hypothetical protein
VRHASPPTPHPRWGDALVRGLAGERAIPLEQFFLDAGQTAIGDDELLVGFRLHNDAGSGWAYQKIKHVASSWPIATAAALLWLDEDHRLSRLRVLLGAVSARPISVELDHLRGPGSTTTWSPRWRRRQDVRRGALGGRVGPGQLPRLGGPLDRLARPHVLAHELAHPFELMLEPREAC